MAYLSKHMEQLAEQLSQEEIMCDEGVEEDHEEIKKLQSEKVIKTLFSIIDSFKILNIST